VKGAALSDADGSTATEFGRATVVRARDTDTLDGPNPVIDLEIEISVDLRPSYVIRRRESVPRVYLGRVAPGASVPVAINRYDPNDVSLLWNRP
jgi:hypothetical protein